jgi:hypothetical protein
MPANIFLFAGRFDRLRTGMARSYNVTLCEWCSCFK